MVVAIFCNTVWTEAFHFLEDGFGLLLREEAGVVVVFVFVAVIVFLLEEDRLVLDLSFGFEADGCLGCSSK